MTAPARARPNVFSIPPGAPFLAVLVDRLLDGTLVPGFPDSGDPLSLARATILLPTRRACRALEAEFLRRAGPALLLPRIRPIGDVDEDELAFDPDEADDAEPAADLPPLIKPLQRRVDLTRLVLAWARRLKAQGQPVLVPASPADAAFLAGELARLMDTIATEGCDWSRLTAILPDDLQAHWQITVEFLSIATMQWPGYLRTLGVVEPAERRRLLLEAEAARLSRLPPEPVIAAGSTGSIPATAHLLATIAKLPRGAVVLPGLDRDLDPVAWDALLRTDETVAEPAPSHPQTALRHLLHGMDRLGRDEVRHLDTPAPSRRARLRERLMSEVMRPAETTDAWNRPELDRAGLAAGLEGVSLLEAANEHEEALAIAVCLRETLESTGQTAALITPDRMLARRVAAELTRFGLSVDDTSGRPLGDTPAGVLARLVADVARDQLDPHTLLALLHHPLARFGLPAGHVRRAARALERAALRGPRIDPGVAGLRHAMSVGGRRTEAGKGLSADDRALAADLMERIASVFAPLEGLFASIGNQPARQLFEGHMAAIDAVVRLDDGGDGLVREDDGRALRLFLDELSDTALDQLETSSFEYPDLFAGLMGGRTVRQSAPSDPRLRIYGLLEARLVRHDRVVLAGLVEGVWPAATRTDPWLSRTMRGDMGLPAPERRVGLSAHDLVQGMGADEVILTRSLKRGGAPTVPSRWLQRLEAVLGPGALDPLRTRAEPWLAIARALDDVAGPPRPAERPAPRPPFEARPRSLSVTEMETLLRDPYSIYARHILRLRPWEAVGEDVTGADKGIRMHDALARYADAVTKGASGGLDLLLSIGREVFDDVPAAYKAFWWPRFERIAAWFVGFDAGRRAAGSRVYVEISGRTVLKLTAGPFELRGRADRIEQALDGTVSVIDFKSGRVPTLKEVQAGFSPQLPLEAAMIGVGAFAEVGLPPGLVPAELLYIGLKGGTPPAEPRPVGPKDMTIDAFATETMAKARAHIERFDDPDTPYKSMAATRWRLTYGAYDHLARVREWGVVGDGGGEE